METSATTAMVHPPQFTEYVKHSLVAIASSMTFLLSISCAEAPAIANPPTSPFGLGIESFNRLGGAVRCRNSAIGNAIAPEDGGRTLSSRPTFYLYVKDLDESEKNNYRISFYLRNGVTANAKPTYRVVGDSKKLGLLKFPFPDNAPVLELGKDMRWQVRIAFGDYSTASLMSINAFVRLEQNEEAETAIRQARSTLEKARIYARYYYWYDAFDAYMQWLDANPSDAIARQERSNMMVYAQVAQTSEKRKCALVTDIPLNRIESQKSESLQLSPTNFRR
jgi:hypothetical protein